MLVVTGNEAAPDEVKGGVLAIGNFDGVHKGHQALIAKVCAKARTLGAPAGVIVFEPHPRELFQPNEPHFHLTPLPLKLKRLAQFGIDVVVVLKFDRAFASLSANQFIEDVLVARLAPRHIVIGYDFFFGKGRAGTPETMKVAGQDLGFGVSVVSPVAEDGEVFSSTGVRLKLAQGDVRGAAVDLGQPWRVRGRVVGGAKRGTGLGFPTANIALQPGTALAHGIYAVWVEIADGQTASSPLSDIVSTAGGDTPAATQGRHMGVAYLGTRPTFDDGGVLLEIFLLDFDGDLYGRTLEVSFVEFIRADRRFNSPEELVAQMQVDCEAAYRTLAADR